MSEDVGFLTSGKAALVTAAGAIGASVVYALDIIPDDIVKLSALLGCILTAILIYNHIRAKNLKELYVEVSAKLERLEKLQIELIKETTKQEVLIDQLGKIANDNMNTLDRMRMR